MKSKPFMYPRVGMSLAGGEAVGQAVRAVLGLPENGKCSLLLFAHGHHHPRTVRKVKQRKFRPCIHVCCHQSYAGGNDAWVSSECLLKSRYRQILDHYGGSFGLYEVEVGGSDGDGGYAWLTQLSRVIERARKVKGLVLNIGFSPHHARCF